MKKVGDSWRHHAFPYTLQKYWTTGEDICWLDSTGRVVCKPFGRKTTGWMPNGHSVVFDQAWGTGPNAIHGFNFEEEFEYIDNLIPDILSGLEAREPSSVRILDTLKIFGAAIQRKTSVLEVGNDLTLQESEHRRIVELLLAIVHRSLFQRRVQESFSNSKQPEDVRNIGTANIRTAFSQDQKIAKNGPIANQHILALYDPEGGFVFPDGLPNWIVMRANDGRIWGRLIVPLTPRIVIYFSTPQELKDERQLTCWQTPKSVRAQINEVLHSFSEGKTYFQGRRPNAPLTQKEQSKQYLDPNSHPLFRLFDLISGYREPVSLDGMRQTLAEYFLKLGHLEEAGGEIVVPPGFRKRGDLVGSHRLSSNEPRF